MAAISKSYLSPHQHDLVVASKLEAQRAQYLLDQQAALQQAATSHAQELHAAERRFHLQIDELKLHYENEFHAAVDGTKKQLAEAEARLQVERAKQP